MKNILITGGAGFIPSSLADKLLMNTNYFVVAIDNLLTGSLDNLPETNKPNYRFIKADVNNYNDIAAIMTAYKFDYVFHYAAIVGVSRTLNNPCMVLDDIGGIKNVLQLAKNTSVKRVFYSSSSEVYGEPVEFPQNEYSTPLNSRLPYAIVKNLGESFCKSYFQEFGLFFTIFRFFNTYGPKQSIDLINISTIFSTKMFCEETQQTEDAFFKQLEKVNRFEIKGKTLMLYRDKELLLEFVSE